MAALGDLATLCSRGEGLESVITLWPTSQAIAQLEAEQTDETERSRNLMTATERTMTMAPARSFKLPPSASEPVELILRPAFALLPVAGHRAPVSRLNLLPQQFSEQLHVQPQHQHQQQSRRTATVAGAMVLSERGHLASLPLRYPAPLAWRGGFIAAGLGRELSLLQHPSSPQDGARNMAQNPSSANQIINRQLRNPPTDSTDAVWSPAQNIELTMRSRAKAGYGLDAALNAKIVSSRFSSFPGGVSSSLSPSVSRSSNVAGNDRGGSNSEFSSSANNVALGTGIPQSSSTESAADMLDKPPGESFDPHEVECAWRWVSRMEGLAESNALGNRAGAVLSQMLASTIMD